jgi:hypothetical protein
LENKVNLTPREHAARNEIIALRDRIAELEGKKGVHAPAETPQPEVKSRK